MTLSIFSPSEPQHDISVPSASYTQCMLSLGWSHLLQHLSMGPAASLRVLLVPHSTHACCGSASAHRQRGSGKLRVPVKSSSIQSHRLHTLRRENLFIIQLHVLQVNIQMQWHSSEGVTGNIYAN